ncbi:MAG: glycosyltransferase family 2 protein [candidate division WOR-3 bacterium]
MTFNINRIGVIIPAYQAEKEIAAVITSLYEIGFTKENIIVVDDGSTDRTYDVAKGLGATVLQHKRNLGKGAALNTGFEYAITVGFDGVITIDADKQHLSYEIYNFLKSFKTDGPDLLLGNRLVNTRGMPFIRLITNRITSLVVSLLIGQQIPDSQCGFRLLRTSMLKKVKPKTTHYEAESELIICAGRLGFSIESVPITTIYTGGKSYINPIIDTIRFTIMAIKQLWR